MNCTSAEEAALRCFTDRWLTPNSVPIETISAGSDDFVQERVSLVIFDLIRRSVFHNNLEDLRFHLARFVSVFGTKLVTTLLIFKS